MKISWGTAIAIFYTCFVIAMVSMVVKSTHNKAQMVQDNYYDKDLNYEAFRLKRENASNMKKPVEIDYAISERKINIQFPEEMLAANGKVDLFRPSNASMDISLPIQLSEDGKMSIPIDAKISNGLWRVQIEWQNKGTSYYKETVITI